MFSQIHMYALCLEEAVRVSLDAGMQEVTMKPLNIESEYIRNGYAGITTGKLRKDVEVWKYIGLVDVKKDSKDSRVVFYRPDLRKNYASCAMPHIVSAVAAVDEFLNTNEDAQIEGWNVR